MLWMLRGWWNAARIWESSSSNWSATGFICKRGKENKRQCTLFLEMVLSLIVKAGLKPGATCKPFLFWTAISADFQGDMKFLNPLCEGANNTRFIAVLERSYSGETVVTSQSLYKPASVMEWRASRVPGKTLYKATADSREKAAFPGERSEKINK